MGRKRRILNAADEYAALVRLEAEAGEKLDNAQKAVDAASNEYWEAQERTSKAARKLTAATAPRGAGVNSGSACTPTEKSA